MNVNSDTTTGTPRLEYTEITQKEYLLLALWLTAQFFE